VVGVDATDDQQDQLVVRMQYRVSNGPSGDLAVRRDGTTYTAILGPFEDDAIRALGNSERIDVAVIVDDAGPNPPVEERIGAVLQDCELQ
jgi:hypothetical protein